MRKIVLLIGVITSSLYATTGKASWYGAEEHGKLTASGEVYNMYSNTCASNSHKLGTLLKVTNLKNNKSTVCRVNDTGGFKKYGRILDLSKAGFSEIAKLEYGVIGVEVEVIGYVKRKTR